MSDVFISYAHSTAEQAQKIADALRALGHGVWRDDELPAHRSFAEVIEERLRAAKAVVVVWSAEAVKSEWVQSEADRARLDRKLVQLTIDGAVPPMPFDRIQCADMTGWSGDLSAPGWTKVVSSIAELVQGGLVSPTSTVSQTHLPAAPASPPPEKLSIAVMPFANLSGDPEQDYFADGMMAEINEALSRFRELFVIATSSTMVLKGQGLSAQEAARRLGVRYIVEGSVRKAGSRVRVAVQLIEADSGVSTWSRRFEDTLDDVFALQDSVALGVAAAIFPAVQGSEQRLSASTPNPTSYDLYLRAWALILGDKAAYLRSLELLDQAIAADAAHARPYALAANHHAYLVSTGWADDPDLSRVRGLEMASRALQLAPYDADVLWRVADAVWILRNDLDGASALADRAVELNPASTPVLLMSSYLRIAKGEPEPALERIEETFRLSPLDPFRSIALCAVGMATFAQGRFTDALAHLKEASDLNPNWPYSFAFLAACYGQLGQVAEAQQALARYRQVSPKPLDEMLAEMMRHPDHQRLFLEGVAIAERASLAAAASG